LLSEPERLFGSDLEGEIPRRCRPDDDGWLVDIALAMPPALRILAANDASVSTVELRLRLDKDTVCADAISARIDGFFSGAAHVPSRAGTTASQGTVPVDAANAIPTFVTDRASGRRWELRCGE